MGKMKDLHIAELNGEAIHETIERKRYFITVERCNDGKRGIFCDRQGIGFPQDTQHTTEEMNKLLGLFFLILNPKSEPFTENEIKKFSRWIPLAEYKNNYGVAIKPDLGIVAIVLKTEKDVVKLHDALADALGE